MIEWFFLGVIIGFIIFAIKREYDNRQMIDAAADAAISELKMAQDHQKMIIDLYKLRYDIK
jgi:hypothetical protein